MKALFENEVKVVPANIEAPAGVAEQVLDILIPARVDSPIVVASPTTIITDSDIDGLGSANNNALADITNQMLSQVKASDSDAFGEKLSTLITTARKINPSGGTNQSGLGGIINKAKSLFVSSREQLLDNYQSVEQRIDTLVGELSSSCDHHRSRINDLEHIYISNMNAHSEFEASEKKGEVMLVSLQQQLDAETAATDAFAAQRVADVRYRMDRVEKRIDDLKRKQLLAKQAAPQIRMMQDNARCLAEKFTEIQITTIPAWKQTFTLYLMQLEQKKGAELANSIHDATDEAFKMQADLLRQNTGEIAKAKQRSVVSIETLQHVQEQLLGSLDDAMKIADEGKKSRKEATIVLKDMEQKLVTQFIQ